MEMEAIEREEVEDGFVVEIVPEEVLDDFLDPRDWSNLGTMLCSHPRYTLGDEQISRDSLGYYENPAMEIPRELVEERGATVVLPLFLLDHSGLSMSAGANVAEEIREQDVSRSGKRVEDSYGWDVSMVGFIFDTPKGREDCGTPPEMIEEVLRQEVAVYDQFLQGDVVAYVVRNPGGNVVGGCGGFYPDDSAGYGKRYDCILEEARAEARALAQEARDEAARLQREEERVYSEMVMESFRLRTR